MKCMVTYRLYAEDSTGEISPDLVIKINICHCHGHGDCLFDDAADDQPEGAANFVVVACECNVGWDGKQ